MFENLLTNLVTYDVCGSAVPLRVYEPVNLYWHSLQPQGTAGPPVCRLFLAFDFAFSIISINSVASI